VSHGGQERREEGRNHTIAYTFTDPTFFNFLLPLLLPFLRRGLPVRVLKLYRRMRRKGVEPSASALTQVGREGGREGGRERGREKNVCSRTDLQFCTCPLLPSLPSSLFTRCYSLAGARVTQKGCTRRCVC